MVANRDADLKQSLFLFKVMERPWMVTLGKVATHGAFALRLPVNGIIKKTIFRQFCGGESIEDCDHKIADLHQFNIGTILDYSVEGKTTVEDLEATKNEIIATIKKAKILRCYSVFGI